MAKIPKEGTRAQVFHGNAVHTSGGLTKKDLMMNKHGRIVSRAKHQTAKKEMRLLKYGYGTKKGKFGFVKNGSMRRTRKHRTRSRKNHRGGSGGLNPWNPASLGDGVDGQGLTHFGRGSDNVQIAAGMAGGKRRHHYGGAAPLNPAPANGNGIDGQGLTNFGRGSDNVQIAAGMAGGKRRHRYRGGAAPLNPAPANGSGIDGQGLTNFGRGSDNVQIAAGMAGGKRRHRHRGGLSYRAPRGNTDLQLMAANYN